MPQVILLCAETASKAARAGLDTNPAARRADSGLPAATAMIGA
jgi:hypothetical protein